MIVAQEYWYISKGNVHYRKNITVYYKFSQQYRRETVAFKEHGYDPHYKDVTLQELQTAFQLPSIEITPSQFKDILKKRKSIFGV